MAVIPQVYRAGEVEPATLEAPGYCPHCGGPCALRSADGRVRAVCTRCARVRYRNPSPGVAVVVHDAERVVLVRRTVQRPGSATWGIPAGFVEYDEDFLTAAHREVREETGLEIELRGLANLSSNFFRGGLQALVGVLCARAIGGMLRPGDDVEAVRWAPMHGPPLELAFDGDRVALTALAEGRLPMLPIDPRFRRWPPCG